MRAAYDNNGKVDGPSYTFLSCGKHLGSANSIAVTGTTKEVLFSETVMRLQSIIKDEDSKKKEACQKGGPKKHV